MKVLQVNCVYNNGSTGKIVHDIHIQLQKQGFESIVCYGRGKNISEPGVYKTCGEIYSKFNNLLSRFTGLMYGGCFFSTKKLISIIEKEKPDIVHVHCINGYFVNIYRFITWLKEKNIKTVLTLHAEFMHTANCGHALECDKWLTGCGVCPRLRQETKSLFIDGTARSWKKMKKAFDGFENLTITSVSPWLESRAKQSPIFHRKESCVIFNGLDTEVFKPCDISKLRKELGLEDKKIIFHATPAFNNRKEHIKGGYYVLKIAEKMLGSNMHFIIAGDYAPDILQPSNMTLLGNVSDQQKLAEYYSLADVTLLASKKETFSMIVAESLCCGTPVVGFEAGAPEQIALKEYSSFVPYGDVDALAEMVQKTLTLKCESKEISREAKKFYSKEHMTESYIELYR